MRVVKISSIWWCTWKNEVLSGIHLRPHFRAELCYYLSTYMHLSIFYYNSFTSKWKIWKKKLTPCVNINMDCSIQNSKISSSIESNLKAQWKSGIYNNTSMYLSGKLFLYFHHKQYKYGNGWPVLQLITIYLWYTNHNSNSNYVKLSVLMKYLL